MGFHPLKETIGVCAAGSHFSSCYDLADSFNTCPKSLINFALPESRMLSIDDGNQPMVEIEKPPRELTPRELAVCGTSICSCTDPIQSSTSIPCVLADGCTRWLHQEFGTNEKGKREREEREGGRGRRGGCERECVEK